MILHYPLPSLPPYREMLFYLHRLFHPNISSLLQFIKTHLQLSFSDISFLKELPSTCKVCLQHNPTAVRSPTFLIHQAHVTLPGVDWKLDFTHRPTVRRSKYILVMVDIFSGRVEAIPTSNKMALSLPSSFMKAFIALECLAPSIQTMSLNSTLKFSNNLPSPLWSLGISTFPFTQSHQVK